MADKDKLQYIELADFSPGIAQGYHTLTAEETTPDGFASEQNTYNCFPLPNGGLAPLPRITFTQTAGDPNTGVEGQKWPDELNYPDDYFERIAVLDAMVVSPVTLSPPLDDAIPNTVDNVNLFTVRQWYMVSDDDTKVDCFWRFRGHPIFSGDASAAFAARDIHAWEQDANWDPHPSRWKYGWGSIMQTRTNSPDLPQNEVGPPVIIGGMGGIVKLGGVNAADPEGVECAGYYTFPDYHTSTPTEPIVIDSTYPLTPVFGAAIPGIVFGHQGRLLAIGRQPAYKYGRRLAWHDVEGVAASTELVFYWPVNDVYDEDVRVSTFAEEFTSGYGSWYSVNANSLLLIKNQGGAVLVNGDINNPSVTRLPGVPSIGAFANRGCVTDKGYAYGSVSGVWMWTGSDTAVHLSPNLSPTFWVPSDDPTIERRQLGQLNGSFAFKYPFIYAPNNWVMDIRSGGWFRYHPTPAQSSDGILFAFNEVDYTGNLWATVPSYKLGGEFFCKFDADTPASYFTWQSQPIVKARNRVLNLRELQLVVSGEGRVTVTITGLDDETPQPITFDSQSNDIHIIKTNIGVRAKDFTIRIESEAFDDALAAPIVHRVSIGYGENQQVGDRIGR